VGDYALTLAVQHRLDDEFRFQVVTTGILTFPHAADGDREMAERRAFYLRNAVPACRPCCRRTETELTVTDGGKVWRFRVVDTDERPRAEVAGG
jgi:hypothetical protein